MDISLNIIGQGLHYFKKFWNVYVETRNTRLTGVYHLLLLQICRADFLTIFVSLILLGLEVDYPHLALLRPLKLLR